MPEMPPTGLSEEKYQRALGQLRAWRKEMAARQRAALKRVSASRKGARNA